ncbi:MAG: late competence development ComFB family protein [Cyanobacteria bacterium J06626_18]
MGNDKGVAHQKVYINVMEAAVIEEVDKQLRQLPDRVVKYIRRSEVETFALNRLPALYASSEKGFQHQRDRALQDLKPQIANAVRQAFAAVQVDPIRLSEPLKFADDSNEADAVLQALREWFHTPELTWQAALKKIQRLQRRGKTSSSKEPGVSQAASRMNSMPSNPPTPSSGQAAGSGHNAAWRPGTYGSRLNWKPRKHHSEPGGGFDDDHLM